MKRNWILFVLAGVLLAAIVFAGYVYVAYDNAFGSSFAAKTTRADWGVMGDFFGGTLNPLFSLLGLLMLMVTLLQNQKELELSRKELRKSNRALKAQASTLEKQRFEDTFFSLLDQFNRTLERVLSEGVRYDHQGKPSKTSSTAQLLKQQIIGSSRARPQFGPDHSLAQVKTILLADNAILNQCFRILYQVLKLIATKSPDTTLPSGFSVPNLEETTASPTEKFYSNIVRSFVPENVYYLLAVNCSIGGPSDSFYPYKLLIERYAFLEHMPLNLPEQYNLTLVQEIVSHYSTRAFGNNPDYVPRG